MNLEQRIEELAAAQDAPRDALETVVGELFEGLETGSVRAAERGEDGEWTIHAWVKRGILLAFRLGRLVDDVISGANGGLFAFRDKHNLSPRTLDRLPQDVRIVPGGTTVRAGAHIGSGSVIMPPSYVNVGAFVGAGSMIDSHALVGSCAQVGDRVHVSAAAQIGGVLEPAGACPVIIEDDALVGGSAGLYEGVLVRESAVIGAGVVLTRSTPILDLVRETEHRANSAGVLEVPSGAVVVMGSRPARSEFAKERGLQVATPLIVKYRDAATDARVALEAALRPAED